MVYIYPISGNLHSTWSTFINIDIKTLVLPEVCYNWEMVFWNVKLFEMFSLILLQHNKKSFVILQHQSVILGLQSALQCHINTFILNQYSYDIVDFLIIMLLLSGDIPIISNILCLPSLIILINCVFVFEIIFCILWILM